MPRLHLLYPLPYSEVVTPPPRRPYTFVQRVLDHLVREGVGLLPQGWTRSEHPRLYRLIYHFQQLPFLQSRHFFQQGQG